MPINQAEPAIAEIHDISATVTICKGFNQPQLLLEALVHLPACAIKKVDDLKEQGKLRVYLLGWYSEAKFVADFINQWSLLE